MGKAQAQFAAYLFLEMEILNISRIRIIFPKNDRCVSNVIA